MAQDHLVLNGLNLNNTTGTGPRLELDALTFTPARKRVQFVQGADSDGSVPADEARYDNGQMVATVRAVDCTTLAEALGQLALVTQRLEDVEATHEGLPLVWTPATDPFNLRVVSGQMDEIQVTPEAGWTSDSPTRQLTLATAPFAKGAEVTTTAVTSSAPVVTTTVTGVTGDVPAEGRLIVTDAASQSRRHMEWGLEQRHYDSATSLLIDSDSFVTTGFAGSQATATGAYDPDATGNNVVAAFLNFQTQAILGLGDLSHVGTFRVKARVYWEAQPQYTAFVRLAWQIGDSPMTANAYAKPLRNVWSEIDLGLVSISGVALGAQRWTAQIEAYADISQVSMRFDYLVLIPVSEGYGLARASYTYSPGLLSARDEFTGGSGALNARIAPSGGSWATSGATTDFTISSNQVVRSTTGDAGPRYAVLGATNYTATQAEIKFQVPSVSTVEDVGVITQAVIARWIDASNYLVLKMDTDFTAGQVTPKHSVVLQRVEAGVVTEMWRKSIALDGGVWRTLRLVVHASGAGRAMLLDGDNIVTSGGFKTGSMATGGTLASGKPGFLDQSTLSTVRARNYDNFAHFTPAAEPIVIHPSQSLEVRHDEALRENAAGTQWGAPQSYRGSRFLVPPAGSEARTSRVLVKARRNDLVSAADDSIADATTVQIAWTPRYIDPR